MDALPSRVFMNGNSQPLIDLILATGETTAIRLPCSMAASSYISYGLG